MKFSFTVHCETLAELKEAIRRIDGAAGSIEMPRKIKDLADEPPPVKEETTQPVNIEPSEDMSRENVDPGQPSIVKIGSNTKNWIIDELKNNNGREPEHFGEKYQEHLKLLWSRNEIKFDGEMYYL